MTVIVQPGHAEKLCKFIHFASIHAVAHTFVTALCPSRDFFVSFPAPYRINLHAASH